VSWKPQIQVAGDQKWYDNAVRFATRVEAEKYARDLFYRWTSAKNQRATESDDPVNASWVEGAVVWKDVKYRQTTVDDHEL